MHKVSLLSMGGSDLHLPRLIGSLIMFAALLGVFMSSAHVFEATKSIKSVNQCLGAAKVEGSTVRAVQLTAACQELSYKKIGVYPLPIQDRLNFSQVLSLIFTPLIEALLWLAVLAFGMMLYNTRKVFVPLRNAEPVRRLVAQRARRKPTKRKRK
ncbi:MAG: hypothetical protein GOV15_01110 [Candidatus Diapherotrites archaeon]|nr:hypothetical protein [Candidatus Diapherotrites archaeon]